MPILKFRVFFEEDDTIYRDIALFHTDNFLSLHQAILKSFEFDNKHDATFFRSNGKIYVVVLVLATIFAGLFIFLIYLDKKIKNIENN